MGLRGPRSRSARWLPGRTPGNADSYEDRPLFALGAPVGRPLGPKTPSRQASGVQDALPASPLEPKTLSRQATWVLDALLAGPLEPKTPFRPGSLRPRSPFDAPSEVQDPLWAPTTLS